MPVLQDIKVPLLSVNDTSLTVVSISFANGHPVKKGDVLMVFETSKTTYDVEADSDGFVQYYCETGAEYPVNERVAAVFASAGELETVFSPEQPVIRTPDAVPTAVTTAPNWNGQPLFSAEAERLIAARGIDRNIFAGRDFVSSDEVEQLTGNKRPATTATINSALPEKSKPAITVDHSQVIIQKLTSGKKKEINFLADVQATGLTSTINTFINTGGLFHRVNASLQYLKNSLLPLLVYETARLLKKFPLLNAYYSDGNIALFNEVNVGFAIDIDKGLKVLKLPSTNAQTLQQLETGILRLSEKYLDDKLDIADLTGISFTITDLSAEGVSFFRPLVNMMNSAILGVSAIDERLNRCTLSVTFDHRVTEGKYVARFLQELKERMESYLPAPGYRTKEISCFKCHTLLADDLGDIGFAACIQPDGTEGYVCQRCFKGF